MSVVTSLASSAIDLAKDNKSGKTLDQFLTEMTEAQTEGINSKVIDTDSTFEVTMDLYPAATDEVVNNKKGLVGTLVSAAKSAVKNAANNLTGGLLGNALNNVDILKERDNWYNDSDASDTSFMSYLLRANLLTTTNDDNWLGGMSSVKTPISLNLTYFTQEITVPTFNVDNQTTNIDFIGTGVYTSSNIVKTDNNDLTFSILNTKVPLIERIFYPWMRELVSPVWCYDSQPYTTATITIDFTRHADIKYVFIGCRPKTAYLLKPQQQESTTLTRSLTMTFDAMFVHSELKTTDSVKDKLLDTAKGLVSGVGNTLKL
jgi:hypothetical protein